MSAEGIRLYDPTAAPRAVAAVLAPRLTTLAGKRIGILDAVQALELATGVRERDAADPAGGRPPMRVRV